MADELPISYDKFQIAVGSLETGSYRYEVYDTSGDSGRRPTAADVLAGDRGEGSRSNRGDRNEWASGQRGNEDELEPAVTHRILSGQI